MTLLSADLSAYLPAYLSAYCLPTFSTLTCPELRQQRLKTALDYNGSENALVQKRASSMFSSSTKCWRQN